MAHKTIRLADAQIGMQLAGDVCAANGGMLLAAGSALSEGALAALARRGITKIEVVEVLSQEERASRMAEIDRRLDVLFRHAGDDALLRKLCEIVRQHRLEGL